MEMIRTIFNDKTEFSYDDFGSTEKIRLLKIENEIQGRLINIKNDSYEIGHQLYEAKQILSHGMFIPWIKKTFNNDLPYSSAYLYMKIYETYKDNPRTVKYIPTKYLLMTTSNQFPNEINKILNEHPELIDKVKLGKIKEDFELMKSGTIGGSQFLKLAESQIKLGIDLWKNGTKHRINSNMRKSLYFGLGDILERLDGIIEIVHNMRVYPFDPESKEHKESINNIDQIIEKLKNLKIELEGGSGFFKTISTTSGEKQISNY